MSTIRFAFWLLVIQIPLQGLVTLVLAHDPTPDHSLAQHTMLFYIAPLVPALANLIAYPIAKASLQKAPQLFVSYYFASLGFRSLLSLFFIIGVYLFTQPHPVTFVGLFFLSYLACSVFEVRTLLANLRPFSKAPLAEALKAGAALRGNTETTTDERHSGHS
jgi:hypothetical protein